MRIRQWVTRAWSIDRWGAAAIVLSLGLNVLGIGYGLPYPPPAPWLPADDASSIWSADTIAPLGPLAAAAERFSWGTWSARDATYPLAHYILLGALYAPVMATVWLTGGLDLSAAGDYPYGLADPQGVLTLLTLIARLTAAVMGAGVVAGVYALTRDLFDQRAARWAAALVAVCPLLIHYAHTENLDVPYVFWMTLGLWVYVRVLRQPSRRLCLALGGLAALAIATKDQAYGVFLLLPLGLLRGFWRQPGAGWRLALGWSVAGLGGWLGGYVLANNLLFNLPRFWLHLEAVQGFSDKDRLLDPAVWQDHWRLLGLALDYLQRSLGWPAFLASVTGLVVGARRWPRQTGVLALPLISYYASVIVFGLFYVHSRHVLPLVVMLAPLTGQWLSTVLDAASGRRWARLGAIALAGYSLLYGLTASLTLMLDSRQAANDWLIAHVPPGARIEVYSARRFLPRYLAGFDVERHVFGGAAYVADVRRRAPTCLVVTEQEYRNNTDVAEAAALESAAQSDPALRALLTGAAGYDLRAAFKFKLHPTLYPDMFYGQNPKILIFCRRP